MADKKRLPELKAKPIIGVPEDNWSKWTLKGEEAREKIIEIYRRDPEEKKRRAKNARTGLTEEARKRQGVSMKEWFSQAVEYKGQLREKMLGENNPAHLPGVAEKKSKTFRTTGRMFIELNSGCFGYVSDMMDKFDLNKSQIIHLATNEIVPSRGKALGLLIRFYNEDIHPSLDGLRDVRLIKK